MDRDYIFRAVRKCKDLHALTDAEIRTLIEVGEREVYREGEGVFSIDHKGKKFYVVIEGRLTLRLKNNNSKEYKKGQLFGEVAILGDTLRYGSIQAREESMLISFDRESLYHSNKFSKELALKITLALSKKVISYFDQPYFVSSEKLIDKGECDYVEFKKSIDDVNCKNIVWTLASFMNANGGTIFIGITDDDVEIVGVEIDRKGFDEHQKMINKELRRRLGLELLKYVEYDIETIENKKIIRIDCWPSEMPVFYKEWDRHGHEKEKFVVRSGSENIRIKKMSEVLKYVKERFKNIR